jgi:hypothetical protein
MNLYESIDVRFGPKGDLISVSKKVRFLLEYRHKRRVGISK